LRRYHRLELILSFNEQSYRDYANNDNERKQLWHSLKFNDTLTSSWNNAKAIDKVSIKFYDHAIGLSPFIVKMFQRLL